MRKRNSNVLAASILAGAMAVTSAVSLLAQSKKPAPPVDMPKVGDVAPDFTLLLYDGQGVKPVSLHDFKGKKQVALAFFVFAFTGG